MSWEIIEKIAIVLGLVTVVSGAMVLWAFVGKVKAALKRWYSFRKGKASKSAVLFVTIGQASGETAVIKYINSNTKLKSELKIRSFEDLTETNFYCILKEEPIDFNNPAATELYETEIHNQLRTVCRNMKRYSVDRVHLFYCGPYTFAVEIGAELSNRCTVVGYHYVKGDKDGYYRIGNLV